MDRTKAVEAWIAKADKFFSDTVDEKALCYHHDNDCGDKKCPYYWQCRAISYEGDSLGFKMD